MKVVAVVLALLLAGCGSPVEPGAGPISIRTEGAEFALSPSEGVAVSFTIENRGTAPVFVGRCGERVMTALDRPRDGAWVQYGGDACQTVHEMAPLEVAPGESVRGLRGIHEPGRYRLRVEAGPAPGGALEWTAASNVFTVR